MKLEYLKLENFALIRAGMKLNELELDFRNTTNTINLIIGNNGTGKTGILSNLHPFATLGHLEARDDSDLIIPGKNGKKTCIFSTKKHLYYIEHVYQWQGEGRSRKITSHIKKDGKELNPPGTVTSFLEIVEREFDIDVNLLKLLRLGGNVVNFIELTSSGRISFISKLMAAIEPYLEANKVARKRVSELTANLKAAISKKDKLGISNVDEIQRQLSVLNSRLTELQNRRDSTMKEYFLYLGKMDSPLFATCEEEISKTKSRIIDMKTEMKKLPRGTQVHVKLGAKDCVQRYNEKISQLDEKKTKLIEKIASISAEVNSLVVNIETVEKAISGATSRMEILALEDQIEELQKKIEEYRNEYGTEAPGISADELVADVDKINMIFFHLDNIFNLEDYAIRYFCDKLEEYSGDLNALDEYARDRLMFLHRQLDVLNAKVGYNSKRSKKLVMFVPPDCVIYNKCPYYNAYAPRITEDNSDRSSIEKELICVENISGILNSFYSIKKILSMRSRSITQYSVTEENVLRAIRFCDKSMVVDASKVQQLRDWIEQYTKNVDHTKSLINAKMELALKKGSSNGTTKEEYTQQLEDLKREMSILTKEKSSLYEDLTEVNENIAYFKQMIEDVFVQIDYQKKLDEFKNSIAQSEFELEKLSIVLEQKTKFVRSKQEYESKISEINRNIEYLTKEIQDLQLKQALFQQLTQEIEKIEERYSYVTDIRDATSSSEGIPLVHIQMYCKSLCTIANTIIKELYTGDFRLTKFDISDSSFTIPYTTKGFSVKDIRYGSQAEVSVAKLAISFAILSQFVMKYNIILLDEIDGPMHRINKERFFAALEGELDRLKCEQAFIITQSTMFNEYPVNLIVTDPEYKNLIPKNAPVVFQR